MSHLLLPQNHSQRRFRLFPPFLGLQFRVTCIASFLVGLSVVLTSFFLLQVMNTRFREFQTVQAIELARKLENKLGAAMALNDSKTITATLQREFSTDPKIAFIELRAVRGEILGQLILVPDCWDNYQAISSGTTGESTARPIGRFGPEPLPDPEFPEALIYERGLSVVKKNGNAARNNSTQDNRNAVGTVLIGLVDPDYRQARASLQQTAVIIATLVFFASIPISAIFVRRVTRPLRRIARATEEFSSAQNVQKIKVRRRDEIGQLAESFNRMVERLADAHAALLRINEGLEETIAERTAEVRLMNDLLQQEVDSKNEFIRTITHDLNAPLRNIAGMAQMIRKHHADCLPNEVIHRIERIEANVALETAMLDDLLELSRLRTRPYRRENINLAAVFEEIRQTLEPEILERKIEWVVAESFPTIHLEPRLFRQVFMNLIDNAIKYMGERPVRRISIAVAQKEGWLVLSVADTGPGIMPEAQERVFELFSRGSTALPEHQMAEPGRGVGLANVKTVVERWDGTIQLESKVGVGSTFHVRLPMNHLVTKFDGNSPPRSTTRKLPSALRQSA